MFVGEVDGEAVDLQLAQEVVAGGADLLGDALGPGGEFLVVEGVVEGEHPLAVLDGGELRLVLPGDLLGGRVGGAQRRVLLLQFGEGAQLPVELGVADDGLVVDVVAEAVLLDLFGEVLVALPRVAGTSAFCCSPATVLSSRFVTPGCPRVSSPPGRSGRGPRGRSRARRRPDRTTG